MDTIKDNLLVEAYIKAISFGLDKEFVELLKHEIENRNIDVRAFNLILTS